MYAKVVIVLAACIAGYLAQVKKKNSESLRSSAEVNVLRQCSFTVK